MPENYMQLLDSTAKVTSDVYGKINDSISKSMQLQEQSNEFAVGVTMKAADFAERQRVANEEIEIAKQRNSIAAEEVKFRMAMMPLQVQEHNMRMRIQRDQLDMNHDVKQFNMFNTAVKPLDAAAEMEIVMSGNIDAAKAAANYKGQWRTHVASGGEFNGADYQKGYKKILDKYKGVETPKDEPWDADKSFVMGTLSEDAKRLYDTKHPINKEKASMLASFVVQSRDSKASMEAIAQLKLALPPLDDNGNSPLSTILSVKRDNERREILIMQKEKEADEMGKYLLDPYADEAQKKNVTTLIGKIRNDSDKLRQDMEAANQKIAKGDYTYITVAHDDKKTIGAGVIPSSKVKAAVDANNEKPKPFEDPTKSGFDGNAVAIKASGLEAIFANEGNAADLRSNEMRGIDYNWWQQNPRKEFTNEAKIETHTQISLNVDDLKDDEIYNRFDDIKTNKVLAPINRPIRVPISEAAAEELANVNADLPISMGKGNSNPIAPGLERKAEGGFDYSIMIGGSEKIGGGITSYDQLYDALAKIPNKYKRREVAKDLWASILTAARIDAATATGYKPSAKDSKK